VVDESNAAKAIVRDMVINVYDPLRRAYAESFISDPIQFAAVENEDRIKIFK
jgi:hypothetical protein